MESNLDGPYFDGLCIISVVLMGGVPIFLCISFIRFSSNLLTMTILPSSRSVLMRMSTNVSLTTKAFAPTMLKSKRVKIGEDHYCEE